MKRNYTFMFNFVLVGLFVLSGIVPAFSQKSALSLAAFSAEVRPFDFSDRTYYEHGVEPSQIVKRRSGTDGLSVIDFIDDPRYREVRILGVYPAYNEDGRIVFWNLYGELYDESFRRDLIGKRALDRAQASPLYVFPGDKGGTEFRQAHLIKMGDSYFEKNFLGASVQIVVEYTDLIFTKEGQLEMAALAAKNGVSADGTPIIKTALEIEDLTAKNYVTQRIKGLAAPSEPSYAIAKVIQNPAFGAIAPDAFLLNDLRLAAEQDFVEQFECLQKVGNWCGNRVKF